MAHPEITRKTVIASIVFVLISAAFRSARSQSTIVEHGWFPLLAAGSYIVPYQLLLYVYEKFAWRFLYPKCWLQGYWHFRNHHSDGTRTEGIFELVQSAERIELRNGMNTVADPQDRYVADFWSTSGRLIVGAEWLPNDVVLDYSYCVRRRRNRVDDPILTHAHEDLTVRIGGHCRYPDKLEGRFESGLSYLPRNIKIAIGTSINTRITKAQFNEYKISHERLRAELLG